METGLQVLYDCPNCRVEGALIELIVSGGSAGRCRLCGHETTNGVVLTAGRTFRAGGEVRAALAVWAAEDGEAEVEQFVRANFTGRDVEGVVRAVLAGERVETGFDVVAWLFRDRSSGQVAMGGRGPAGGKAVEASDESPASGPPTRAEDGPGGPYSQTPLHATRSQITGDVPGQLGTDLDPKSLAITRALCSVALADGVVESVERAAIDQAVAKLGAPPPTEEDWRVWRPADLVRPENPERVIEAMRHVALSNQLPDPSESRVIREFARYWLVKVGDNPLPPVTFMQKFVKSWEGWFGR